MIMSMSYIDFLLVTFKNGLLYGSYLKEILGRVFLQQP